MDNQTFWKIVKSYFSYKESNSNRITLLKNESILTDEKDIEKTRNNFFIKYYQKLKFKTIQGFISM